MHHSSAFGYLDRLSCLWCRHPHRFPRVGFSLVAIFAALPPWSVRAADLVVDSVQGSQVYSFTTGNAAYDNIYVGPATLGTLNQSGGTLSAATGQLSIGDNAGSNGTYNLNGGTLIVGSVGGNLGTSVFSFNGGALVAGTSATNFFQNLTHAYVGNGGATISTAGFDVTLAQNLEHTNATGAAASDGGLTKTGEGTLTLSGASTYTGGTTVSTGTLAIIGSVSSPGASLTVDSTGGTAAAAAATLSLSGANCSLSVANVYAGVKAGGTINQSGGNFTVRNGMSLGNAALNTGAYNLSGGSLNAGALQVGYSGIGTLTQTGGDITISGASAGQGLFLGNQSNSVGTYTLSGVGTLTTSYAYVGYGGGGTVNQNGGRVTVYANLLVGELAGASGVYNLGDGALGAFSVVVGDSGTGVFNQSGGNFSPYGIKLASSSGSKGTYNFNGGTLTPSFVQGGSGTSTFNFNGGMLVPNQDSQDRTDFFGGLTTANVRNGGVRVDTAGFNVIVAQPLVHSTISGDNGTDGGLVKSGVGTLTLTGANTYTGNTAVNAGTLLAANTAAGTSATGTGRVTVANGATLGGNGQVAGRVDLSSGATLAPGLAGPGRLTLGGDLNFNSRSVLAVELGGTTAGSGYDQVLVAGRLVLGGSNLSVSVVNGFTLAVGQTFDLLVDSGTGLVSGTFANTAAGGTLYTDSQGDTFLVNYAANADGGPVANDVRITVASVVPEPSTWAAVAIGAGLLGWSLRRRAARRA